MCLNLVSQKKKKKNYLLLNPLWDAYEFIRQEADVFMLLEPRLRDTGHGVAVMGR